MPSLKFNKKALQELQPPVDKPHADYFDQTIGKLALRVTRGGVKTFYVVTRAARQLTWLKLGRFPEMTVEQARDAAMRVLGEFASGANPAAVKRAQRAEMTFAQVFDLFLIRKRKRDGSPIGDKTKRDYADVLRLHLASIRNKKLSEIERAELVRIHTRLSKASPSTADKAMALVSSVYGFAIDHEHYAGANPAARVKKNPPKQRDRFLQPDEMPRFFEALEGLENPLMRDFFLLALLTGARRSNLAAMHWRDVDLTSGVWRIPKTKNGSPQNVALPPEAMEVLQARQAVTDPAGWVFPGTGKSGHLVEPRKAWEVLKEAAGLQDVRIHDLRRTLGSWQARNGASLLLIGKSLGHKTPQATAIYARLDLDPVRASVSAAASAMLAAGGKKPAAEVIDINKAA